MKEEYDAMFNSYDWDLVMSDHESYAVISSTRNTPFEQRISAEEYFDLLVASGDFTKEEREEEIYIKVADDLYKKEVKNCTVYKSK